VSESKAAGSHLDWLRARHDALKAERHYDMDVPGYGGRLVLRCKPVPWSAIDRAQQALAQVNGDREGRGSLMANCDVLIASVTEVLVRDEAGDLGPIDPSGETRTIDAKLADLLGSETTTARGTLLWLFPSEIAVGIAAGQLSEWSTNADTELSESIAGE
jgi:hypothetical protein